jgi:hypothetical protein
MFYHALDRGAAQLFADLFVLPWRLLTLTDRDAYERHDRFIGQSVQRGLRATQTVAPRSISAWLKSNTCL